MSHSIFRSGATVWCFLALAPPAALAAACRAQSPAHRVALIELYTSEGCSSCPPADRWLGELSRRFTASQAVALSLHVDYWDDIGWKDAFAQARFSESQRWLSQLAASSTIYTPEVFAGMKELRGWNRQSVIEQRIQDINRQPARGLLRLKPLLDSTMSSAPLAGCEARFTRSRRRTARHAPWRAGPGLHA